METTLRPPHEAAAQPLLVVEGHVSEWSFLLLLIAYSVAVYSSGPEHGWVPSAFAPVQGRLGRVVLDLAFGAPCVAGAIAVWIHLVRRRGRVAFFADRIHFSRRPPLARWSGAWIDLTRWPPIEIPIADSLPPVERTLAWSEVAGFRDGSADFVQLVPRDPRTAKVWDRLRSHAYLAIPTLTEADRVAVLRFLDERGLVRL